MVLGAFKQRPGAGDEGWDSVEPSVTGLGDRCWFETQGPHLCSGFALGKHFSVPGPRFPGL